MQWIKNIIPEPDIFFFVLGDKNVYIISSHLPEAIMLAAIIFYGNSNKTQLLQYEQIFPKNTHTYTVINKYTYIYEIQLCLCVQTIQMKFTMFCKKKKEYHITTEYILTKHLVFQ